MAGVFAVFRTRGPAWDGSRGLEGQADWQGHAAFMDALHAEGFALLVGPLESTAHALLILHADSEAQIETRLAGDPWSNNGLLRTTMVASWTLRLGGLTPDQRR